MVEIRTARPEDASALLEIYAPFIHHSAITFENTVPGLPEFAGRIRHCLERFPWIVACIDGTLAGYVYASVHREREAYQWTCECSVYLHPGFRGKGLGRELYGLLFSLLKRQGLRNIYAGITLPNEASVKLHESLGFRHFATYENVGYKLGAWHNVGWWLLRVNNFTPEPPPPLKFSLLEPESYADEFRQAASRIATGLMDSPSA